MKIICPQKAIQKFRAECRKSYPQERLAALFGHRSDEGNVVITHIHPIRCKETEKDVTFHRKDILRSKMQALRRGEDWLGTIHSHCSTKEFDCCHHLSPHDIKSAIEFGEVICGIVFVDEEGTRSDVYWSVPNPIPEVTYVGKTPVRNISAS